MKETFKVNQIDIGFHPAGFRIDKTASAMNLYTKWQVSENGRWHSCKPVDFDVLPEQGWFKCEGFDWDKSNITEERNTRLY